MNRPFKPNWPFAINRGSEQAQGLLGWWPGTPGARLFDMSGRGNHGVFVNMMPATSLSGWCPGKDGGKAALLFDGTNDAASIAIDLSAYNKITVAFWFTWTTFANNDSLLTEYTANYNSANGIIINPNDSGNGTKFSVFMHGSGGFNGGAFTRPAAGTWHHLCVTFDRTIGGSSGAAAYLNGVSQALSNTIGSVVVGNFANSTLYLMSRATSSLFGTGRLEDCRIYNRLLTGSEIAALYHPTTRWQLRYQPRRTSYYLAPSVSVSNLSLGFGSGF